MKLQQNFWLNKKKREIKMMVINDKESIQNRIKRSFNEENLSFQKSMGDSSIENASKSTNFIIA